MEVLAGMDFFTAEVLTKTWVATYYGIGSSQVLVTPGGVVYGIFR